jgi:hypothetical protein
METSSACVPMKNPTPLFGSFSPSTNLIGSDFAVALVRYDVTQVVRVLMLAGGESAAVIVDDPAEPVELMRGVPEAFGDKLNVAPELTT